MSFPQNGIDNCEPENCSNDTCGATDEVMQAIDCLQVTLNQHYLIAERIMSLLNPDTVELNST